MADASPPLAAASRPFEAGVLDVLRLGRVPYAAAHALQMDLVERRAAARACDTLVLCEHDPVVTVGRRSARPGPAAAGVVAAEVPRDLPVVEVERGGEATYHGPGQLVAYPILLLPAQRRDLHRYLRDLEEVVLRVLAEVGVEGRRAPDATGVWVGARKVCSIGVAVRHWVTWHGLALNLRADLAAFRAMRPCGLDGSVMANLEDFCELPPRTLLFEVLTVKHLCDVFGLRLPEPPPLAPGPAAEGDPRLPIFPG